MLRWLGGRVDILAVQETHSEEEMKMVDFHTVASYEVGERGRGVQTWVKGAMFGRPKILKRRGGSELWVETVEVSTGIKWVVGNVHLRGIQEKEILRDIIGFAATRVGIKILLLGDFNIGLDEEEWEWVERGHALMGVEGFRGMISKICKKGRLALMKWKGGGGTRPKAFGGRRARG